MKKTWFVIFLSLLLVVSISGCRGDAEKDDDNSGASLQNLSENEKLQKIASSLGYDRIEIEDTFSDHIFRWGVKNVENPQVTKAIKEVWDGLVDFDVLQYDELDETYQLKGKTLTIVANQMLEPKQFVDACELLFVTILQENVFSEYDSVSVNVNEPQPGVIILSREGDGKCSTSCPMNDDIQAMYNANTFFSSLDLTRKIQGEYDSILEDTERNLGSNVPSAPNNTASLYEYFQENIPGTWMCLEEDSELAQIEFLYNERKVRFTYVDQESRDFQWTYLRVMADRVEIEISSDDTIIPSIALTITPTDNMLTNNRVLINSRLFEKI